MIRNKIQLSVVGLWAIIIFFVTPSYLWGEVLFQDNFDSHDDWAPIQQANSVDCGVGCETAPIGYVGWRVQGTVFDTPGHNTLNINSDNYRGSSGKGLTYWNESNGGGSSWASDGLLNIDLYSAGYEELYVRCYIKFQTGWQWATDMSPMQKFIRISHFEGGNPFAFFDGGNHHPLFIADLAKYAGGNTDITYFASYRYTNAYYPSGAVPPGVSSTAQYFPPNGNYGGTGTDFWDSEWSLTPAGQGMIGDGDWHCWEFQVKMNSAEGVADGEHRFWVDGVLILEKLDLAWQDTGAARQLWNYVQLGGNNINQYASVEEAKEQWYAIDDLVISTTYVGPGPAAPANLRFK